MKTLDEIPRRNRLDLNTPAELAIYNAIQEVEKAGADLKLTEVTILLQKAKDLISDYVDETKSRILKQDDWSLVVQWDKPSIGFGQLTMTWDEKNNYFILDSELMNTKTVVEIIKALPPK